MRDKYEITSSALAPDDEDDGGLVALLTPRDADTADDTEDDDAFAALETDLAVLMPPERFMYLATDFDGRVVPMGARPQWGLVWPPSETEFVPNQPDLLEVDTFNADERWKMQMVREIRAVHEKLDQTHDPVETFFPLEPLLPYPTAVESVGEQGAQAQTEAEGEGETPAEA